MPDITNEVPLSVLDLPQLHSKPSTATLLYTLSQLAINPSSFSGSQANSSLKIDESGVTGYLTRFVASPLAWITSDKEREEVWEAASQRLSERSGRMAMSSISRTFSICDFAVKRDGTAPRYIHIEVNEPSLTEDNVGHKTWTGSFLLAKRLPHVMVKYFPALLPWSLSKNLTSTITEAPELPQTIGPQSDYFLNEAHKIPSPPLSPDTVPSISCENPAPSSRNQFITPVKVLELGAGTGLTGMAAAALFPNISVHLTDLPSIVPNLVANLETNANLFANRPTVAVLDWSKLPPYIAPCDRYDCILAADSLYDPRHPDWLTNAMAMFLKRQKEARIMIELPFRDMDLPYHDLLREEMARKGFVLLDEGRESGYDDWEGAWCEKMAVLCWWSIWGWVESYPEQIPGVEDASKADEDDRLKVSESSEHDVHQQPSAANEAVIVKAPLIGAMPEGEIATRQRK